MPEYAVHVQTAHVPDQNDEAWWDDLIDDLGGAPYFAAFGAPDGRFDAQLTVEAPSLHVAVQRGADAVVAVLGRAGVLLGDGDVIAVQATTPEEFDRWINTPPDLLSVAEAAELLGLSQQRVRQLALEHPAFPAPIKVGGSLAFPRVGVARFKSVDRVAGRHTPKAAPTETSKGA